MDSADYSEAAEPDGAAASEDLGWEPAADEGGYDSSAPEPAPWAQQAPEVEAFTPTPRLRLEPLADVSEAAWPQREPAAMREREVLARIDERLAVFQAVDWRAAAEADPQGAQAAWAAFSQTVQDREALEHAISAHEAAEAHAGEIETLRRGHAELRREIPEWSPQMAQSLSAFATTEFGFSPAELDTVVDPRLVKLLHKAYRSAENEARSARLKAAQATAPAMTLRSGRGRTDVSANTDDFAAFEKMADARLRAKG